MSAERLAIPSRGAVDLWYARPVLSAGPNDAGGIPDELRWLSPEEVSRWRRFRVEHARAEYGVGKAMTRGVLSRYQDVPPEGWRFSANAKGRPAISEPASRLKFNLTHTTGLVVLAVASDEVGVDAEPVSRRPPWEVAKRCFAPYERAVMEALDGDAKRVCFFEHWTLKESYIKARGIGLGLPLVEVVFERGEQGVRLRAAPGDDPGRWRFAQTDPTGEHRVAVALGVETEIRLTERWWSSEVRP